MSRFRPLGAAAAAAPSIVCCAVGPAVIAAVAAGGVAGLLGGAGVAVLVAGVSAAVVLVASRSSRVSLKRGRVSGGPRGAAAEPQHGGRPEPGGRQEEVRPRR